MLQNLAAMMMGVRTLLCSIKITTMIAALTRPQQIWIVFANVWYASMFGCASVFEYGLGCEHDRARQCNEMLKLAGQMDKLRARAGCGRDSDSG